MQSVTFKCDGCGVKLEPCPPELSAGKDAASFQFFKVGVRPSLVHEMTRDAGREMPSHATSGLGADRCFDLCRNCVETRTLASLLVKDATR